MLGIGERNFASRSFYSCINTLARNTGNESSGGAAENGGITEFLPAIQQKTIQDQATAFLAELAVQKERAQQEDVIRVVDKMPDNYSLLGWILTLFPKAKVIHCRRDLRDVFLSCWLTQFGRILWASRSEDLVDRIGQYQILMDHWRRVLPGRYLELDYEKLVSNQKSESRRLIDWLDLEWDEACLQFYESDRLVRTASTTQVREPIYKSSMGRWKHYREFIPGLMELTVPD